MTPCQASAASSTMWTGSLRHLRTAVSRTRIGLRGPSRAAFPRCRKAARPFLAVEAALQQVPKRILGILVVIDHQIHLFSDRHLNLVLPGEFHCYRSRLDSFRDHGHPAEYLRERSTLA